MSRLYMYVVDRDFGFAPNPFHGYCTLATCKPGIRARAQVNDWVIGMGGARLEATGRCVFAMGVTETLSFDEYWSNPSHLSKRPVRNGSKKMMVGDNIYHRGALPGSWVQADSHHSNPDGTPNPHNAANDTKADRVLLSEHFYYFGCHAPAVPSDTLEAMGFRNGRNYRVFEEAHHTALLLWLAQTFAGSLNLVLADPFDFDSSSKRYSAKTNKVI